MYLLTSTKDYILRIIYFVCRAYVEFYFRYADLPYQHDIELYLDVADIRK